MVTKAGKNKTKKPTKTKRAPSKSSPKKSSTVKSASAKSVAAKSTPKKATKAKSPIAKSTTTKSSTKKAPATLGLNAVHKPAIKAPKTKVATSITSTTSTSSTAKKPKLVTTAKNVSSITNMSGSANAAAANQTHAQPINSQNLLMRHKFTPYSPKHTEQYMNETQKKHFRNILENWKHELMEEVDQTINELKEAGSGTTADLNDRASQEENFNLELRTRDRERKLIKKIEEAIGMLDDGEYGYCEACGDEIGIKRLEARPTALLCIDCKTLDEIREKRN